MSRYMILSIDDLTPRMFWVYTPVDTREDIFRPPPKPHPNPVGAEKFAELVAGIAPGSARVEWACRSFPLPQNGSLDGWAFFVEVAPSIWIMFDDLPKPIYDALMDRNYAKLMARRTQRPFSEEELESLVEEIDQLDPATATVVILRTEMCDPYDFGNVPNLSFGHKEYFVRSSSGLLVWFRDLPDSIQERLRAADRLKFANRSEVAAPRALDVTAEMIRAGVQAYQSFDDDHDHEERIVEHVYRAMEDASFASIPF